MKEGYVKFSYAGHEFDWPIIAGDNEFYYDVPAVYSNDGWVLTLDDILTTDDDFIYFINGEKVPYKIIYLD